MNFKHYFVPQRLKKQKTNNEHSPLIKFAEITTLNVFLYVYKLEFD